jgi:glycerol kinase
VVECVGSDSGIPLAALRVDGGAAANDFLMQFQADILGTPVERPEMLEVTAFGAASLAGLAVGFWSGRDALPDEGGALTLFQPRMDASRREALYADWKRAVERSRDWARD